MTDRLPEESRRIFARLTAIAALGKAQIEANPIPHLKRAARAVSILSRASEEAICALHGLDDLDLWRDEGEPAPGPPFREMCLARNNKAAAILEAALEEIKAPPLD